ncbi:hypothetical protein M3J09_003014 [Ascochyta lentis]
MTGVFVLVVQLVSFAHSSLPAANRFHSLSIPFPRPRPLPIPQFNSYGSTQCLPPISLDLLKKSAEKHATCSRYSPFSSPRTRIGTVTAHFGGLEGNEHYTKAFTAHLEHALVHGTEVHVLCDKMVDDLWNKPAFILDLLFREMAKPQSKRLEWLVWVDRDTLILDQCRPASSFLPSSTSDALLAKWWRRNEKSQLNMQPTNTERSEDPTKPPPEVNLLASNDMNGLNNGIFLLRVSPWSISLFTAILAYRHYNPTIKLKFTEQSAMELVLRDDRFKDQVQLVPQYWFNTYSHGGPKEYVNRNNTEEEGLEDVHARRGDWLIHFAGNERKDEALNGWADMLETAKDIWAEDRVQRNVSGEVRQFWEGKGF